jgi:hypothetical protein
MSKKFILKYLSFFLFVGMMVSCERDYSFRGDGRGLSFSMDTLMFDTVFTTMGSSTLRLKVYNPYNEDLTIDAIELAGGDESNYRININGNDISLLQDVRIRSRDSLFIFVEVTIDPAGVDAPFIVSDSVMFYTRERTQTVKLMAYGQDVVVLKKAKLSSQTLKKGKPYLIYDYAIVDSFQTVSVDPGVHFYFHKDASMVVLGSLKANGTADEPIVFEGDRLEDFYEDIPGQWGFLQFLPGSANNELRYTTIRNGYIGVHADSIGMGNDVPLIIDNCRFEHISFIGLLAERSKIVASNSLFADCGLHSVALTLGGEYEFYHCTIANFYKSGWGVRSDAALMMNNYYYDDNNKEHILPLTKALFANCIVYGYQNPEVKLDFKTSADEGVNDQLNYFFDHSLLKVGTSIDTKDEAHYSNVIINKAPSFVDSSQYDYRLDTLSVAKDVGKRLFGEMYPKDYLGISRLNDTAPDLGMYERVEKK